MRSGTFYVDNQITIDKTNQSLYPLQTCITDTNKRILRLIKDQVILWYAFKELHHIKYSCITSVNLVMGYLTFYYGTCE